MTLGCSDSQRAVSFPQAKQSLYDKYLPLQCTLMVQNIENISIYFNVSEIIIQFVFMIINGICHGKKI